MRRKKTGKINNTDTIPKPAQAYWYRSCAGDCILFTLFMFVSRIKLNVSQCLLESWIVFFLLFSPSILLSITPYTAGSVVINVYHITKKIIYLFLYVYTRTKHRSFFFQKFSIVAKVTSCQEKKNCEDFVVFLFFSSVFFLLCTFVLDAKIFCFPFYGIFNKQWTENQVIICLFHAVN